jgi:hypothetical protein
MRAPPMAVLMASCFALAGCLDDASPPGLQGEGAQDGRADAVVIAIIDSGFDPYHFDLLADHMPQHGNDHASDDLPLWDDPATWLPGHPGAEAFSSYEALELSLTPDDPDAVPEDLYAKDPGAWSSVQQSTPDDVHMRWIPGTKVIGYVNMAGGDGFATASHGVGTTSVGPGNIHGTCPSCLLVFVNGFSDDAVSWVAEQDWIDVQTNSWGYSTVFSEKIYTDCDMETQRAGVERGQQIFFSGGNGIVGAFDAPVPTLYSCQKASDWIVTVGANTPDGATYTGAGKPVDVAGIGSSYPSAGGETVSDDSTFGGTSNASPTTGGLYAQALYDIRHALPGPSRIQQDGTIAVGPAGCGEANGECFLGDGSLTVHELRQALFAAADFQGHSIAAVDEMATVPATTEEWARMGEGAGSFFGRMGDATAEVRRIVDISMGTAALPQDEARDLFAQAVSYCTQHVWGTWDHGAWHGDDIPVDPAWPLRAWLTTNCPDAIGAIVTVAALV